MKILLSPAKSLDFTNSHDAIHTTTAVFLDEANALVRKLQKLSSKKIGQLMHLSSDLADLNFHRFQQWESPIASSEHNKASIFAFSGEVYKGLDAQSLSDEELQRAQSQVRILSGLYGLLKPFDLLYPYRLEMGTKFQVTPTKKNLYAFWGSKIAQQLNEEMKIAGEDSVINLASNEYFKAVDLKTLRARVITPVFKEFKNGEFKIVMMYAKHARGAMARYILQNQIQDPELLKVYNVDGYTFNVHLSSNDEWVFTR